MNYLHEDWVSSGRPPEATAPAADEQLDVRGVLGLLRRKLWLIVTVAVLVMGGATLALFAMKPVYTATALLLVDPSKKNLLDPQSQVMGSSSDSARVDSEVELVKSGPTMLQVADQLGLVQDPEFGVRIGLRDSLLAFFRLAQPQLPSGDAAVDEVIGRLKNAVSVQRRGLTFLIAVQATSARPDFAATLANTVAETYINEQLEVKRSSIENFSTVLANGLAQARENVNLTENQFDDFLQSSIGDISASGNTELAALYQQLQDIKAQNAQLSTTIAQSQQNLADKDWTELNQSLQSQAVATLEQQREDLAARLAGAVDTDPGTVALRDQLTQLDKSLSQAAGTALGDLRDQLSTSETRVSDVRSQIQDALLNSKLPPELQTRIFEILEGAQIARTQYQGLLSRQRDVALEVGLQVADSRLASPATPPSEPSFPNPRLVLALAAIGGLGLGVLLAFLVENFVGGFTSDEQLRSVLRLPTIVNVPRQRPPKRSDSDDSTLSDAIVLSPLSVFSEAIRRVRLGIDQLLRQSKRRDDGQGQVVVVTSTVPNEGKTTTALSLARAYAASGISTLLIDCDLRKPGVHTQLGLKPSAGLLEYLSSKENAPDLQSVTRTDTQSGAQIVLGSRRSDIATDQLVASKTFARLVAAARRTFDVVILDTPPIGPVVDGLYLAGLADVIVFVVKWSSTPQQEVKAAVNGLMDAKPDGTGILAVLAQQERSRRSYSGKYANYYGEA